MEQYDLGQEQDDVGMTYGLEMNLYQMLKDEFEKLDTQNTGSVTYEDVEFILRVLRDPGDPEIDIKDSMHILDPQSKGKVTLEAMAKYLAP